MKPFRQLSLALPPFLALCLMFLVFACGTEEKKVADTDPCSSANGIVADASFNSLWTNVFQNRCGSCHGTGGSGTKDGPDMRTQDSFYNNLLSKNASNFQSWTELLIKDECAAYGFIDPNHANKSLIVAVLDPALSLGACKVKPHKEAPQKICLSDGSLANLKKWIDNGAAK